MIHAPEINRSDVEWLNTDQPQDLAAFRGKLLLLDFWTFCCVNCLHVIPLLHELEAKFGNSLAVIGIHSPKFTHERDPDQVREAVKRYDIRHPVIHDPDRRLWDEYAIRAWPTLVLISATGYILGHYPGEPQAAALEALIERSLEDGTGSGEPEAVVAVNKAPDDRSHGPFKYPAKIKQIPGEPVTWALTDSGHHQVVLLNDGGAELRRFGAGRSGFSDGAAKIAMMNGPEGLCCSEAAIYVADTRNHAIRHIDLESGDITTLAGTGFRGAPLGNYWISRRNVGLASPWDIELIGDRLFFANAGTHQLVELRLSDGAVRPAAGSGREGIRDGYALRSHLAQPSGLAYDAKSQLLYFVDSESSSIRSFSLRDRGVETLVGQGLFVFGDKDGTFAEAKLQHPLGITVCDDKIYIADTYNNTVKIADPGNREVSRLDAGQFACRDALCIPVSEPAGLSCASSERLLLVDTNNHRVVEYKLGNRASMTWSPRPPGSEQETPACSGHTHSI